MVRHPGIYGRVCLCLDSAVMAWRAVGREVSNVKFCVSVKGSRVAVCWERAILCIGCFEGVVFGVIPGRDDGTCCAALRRG